MLIIAHRGASHEAPENTMASINLAWDQDAPAVEIDIRLSKEKEIAVFHDANTKRICGIDKKVKNQTLTELKKLDAGQWKDEKWKGERIPGLGEVLDQLPLNKRLIIELKEGRELLKALHECLGRRTIPANQIELISFNHHLLSQAKKMMPEYAMLALYTLDYHQIGRFLSPKPTKIIRQLQHYGLDGANIWAGKILDKDYVHSLQAASLKVYTWTVDDAGKARALKDMGVDGITTNRPKYMQQALG